MVLGGIAFVLDWILCSNTAQVQLQSQQYVKDAFNLWLS